MSRRSLVSVQELAMDFVIPASVIANQAKLDVACLRRQVI